MANAANLVLKNAAAANVTYFPSRVRGGEFAEYVDRTNGVIAQQSKFTLSYRQTATTRQAVGKVVYPAFDAASGTINNCIAEFKLIAPLVMTAADRSELLARVRAAISDSIVTSALVDGETPY